MSVILTILECLGLFVLFGVATIPLAKLAGRFIRFGSHHEPPAELHPMPSGSMSDRVSP